MDYKITNLTAQTPLGFGALSITVEPGESAIITAEQAATLEGHPVIAAWIDTKMIEVKKLGGRHAVELAEKGQAAGAADTAKGAETAPDVEAIKPPPVPKPAKGK